MPVPIVQACNDNTTAKFDTWSIPAQASVDSMRPSRRWVREKASSVGPKRRFSLGYQPLLTSRRFDTRAYLCVSAAHICGVFFFSLARRDAIIIRNSYGILKRNSQILIQSHTNTHMDWIVIHIWCVQCIPRRTGKTFFITFFFVSATFFSRVCFLCGERKIYCNLNRWTRFYFGIDWCNCEMKWTTNGVKNIMRNCGEIKTIPSNT